MNDNLKIKLKAIKLIIYDVDGVMTDNRIIIGDHPEDELKHFNVKDGLGIKLLKKLGIYQVILTGKQSKIVDKRFSHLEVDAIFQGKQNKIDTFNAIISKFQINAENCLMVGDDLPDLPIFKRAGVSITVQDGHPWILEHADYITKAKGGKGAVREVCDLILTAHNLKEQIINDFIQTGEASTYVL